MIFESVSAILMAVGIGLLFFAYWLFSKAQQFLYRAKIDKTIAEKEITAERREAFFKLKDELQRRRLDFKNELKREQVEIEKAYDRLNSQKKVLQEKELEIRQAQKVVGAQEQEYQLLLERTKGAQEQLKLQTAELSTRLESIALMSQEEARTALFENLEKEVRAAHQRWLQKMEDDVRAEAKERSCRILVDAMQRYTSDCVAGSTACVIHLPNDDMKGRIIGKEGRNIKVLEMSTGVDIIIDDTPEIITLSSFNPVRREIARRSIEKLLADGRINPSRIEDTVHFVEKEVQEIIAEKGKEALLKLNIHNVAPELIQLLGELHFRTSFSQDVLAHSVEVAFMARMLAEELGLSRPDLAARAGLFHDIGKAVSSEHEGPHAQVGAEVAQRCGEDPIVINAIAAHHEEVPFKTPYDILVLIADTISASRPGARRETLAAYLKRLERLEGIANEFLGVKRAFALQAGREIRIIVEEDHLGDSESTQLAYEVARRVENEVKNFPGPIKVNVIREKRTTLVTSGSKENK